MAFDYITYCKVIDEFLIKMEKISDIKHPDTKKVLSGICSFLRITRLEINYFDNVEAEKLAKGRYILIYSENTYDTSRNLVQRNITDNGNVVHYTAYQKKGDDNWSEDELREIEVMLKMLYVFNSRIHTSQVAESLTLYDGELGIYNFPYFMKHSAELISEGKINDYMACYFDIKRFTSINEQLGRTMATKLVRVFINKLSSHLNENDIICRIGGDNFVALFHKNKLENIMTYLKGTNVDYDADKTMFISATAGFYDIPDTVTSPGQIMDCITTSVNAAKHILKQQFVFYKDELQEQINDYMELEKLFPTAIKNEEFKVYYQPKVNLHNYTLAGAEALCRWYHNGEIILPFRFIPMLEQTKAICTLDFYMLEHVCRDIRYWLDNGHTPVKVSVNFSRCHLGNVNLLKQILDIINKYNIPHKYIEIELTETTTDVDFIDLKSIVRGLQAENISTSVDDFGIGYSSLNLIRELPWNVLKIDKSFLTANDDSKKNNIMLKHVISMAHDLGLECIVEGVETTDQIRLLKENHCFNAQGFYFDKPLSKEKFEERLFGIRPYK